MRGYDQCSEDSLRLADLGWTIPLHSTPADVGELLELDCDGINKFYTHYFEQGSFEFLSELRNDLLNDVNLSKWHPIIDQCYCAYKAGYHLVVIPSLLSVLDGYLAMIGKVKGTNVKDALKELIQDSIPESYTRLILISLDRFVKNIFKDLKFDSQRPDILNRHWILHGRDIPDWERADALRLFNALHILSSFIDEG